MTLKGQRHYHKWTKTYATDWEKIFATHTEDNI